MEIQLTEEEFNIIIESLDFYPQRNSTGNLLADMLMIGVLSKDQASMEKWKRDKERKELDAKAERDAVVENITMLKSKIIAMKRQALTDSAIRQTNDILKRKENE